MTTNPLGPGVSRYIDDTNAQFAVVVFQANKPPLDSELNLVSLVDFNARADELRSQMPSGWLMNESAPKADFFTSPNNSNLFFFGRNTPGEMRNLSWAVVNGWTIPVTGTNTGAPPLAADDVDTWNKILLNPPPSATGGNIAEFVFLEVWQAIIDVDPAPPGIAPGKPARGFIYPYGNVLGGFSFLPDNLIDPDINFPTTKRLQIQYRIRVVQGINIAQYPEGFDPTLVFAQGLLTAPSSVPFTNMRQTLGDPGLWRAGTGDPTTFGTSDGYVYAIPLCSVFRRNGALFSDTGNLAGAFNRNSVAILPTDATIYLSTPLALANPMLVTDVSFNVTSIAGTVFQTMNSFGDAYFYLNDEIIHVNNIVQNTPTSFTIFIDRGQLQSTTRAHNAGTSLIEYTTRPDGLFADQIAGTDILDMRHSIAPKFDYDSILKTNFIELLKGNLRSTWKRWGSTNPAGPVLFLGDRITDSAVVVGGLTALDEPDGNRRMYSDSVTVQRFNVPVTVPSNAQLINTQVQTNVAPYNIEVLWTNFPPGHGPGFRLVSGYPSWFNGDQISIQIAPFAAGLPGSDANQVRFVLPSEDPDAVIIRFEGMMTDPNGGLITTTTSAPITLPQATIPVSSTFGFPPGPGTINIGGQLVSYTAVTGAPTPSFTGCSGGVGAFGGGTLVTAPGTTAPTTTNPNLTFPIMGNFILKAVSPPAIGPVSATLDVSGNMVLTLQSGAVAAQLQEFLDALQGNTSPAYVIQVLMHIDFAVVYGSGRGLSHKPDYIHTAWYQGTSVNTTQTLLRDGLATASRMIPTYLGDSPYVQTGVNRTLARTSEVMFDPGSKTVYVAPYREVQIPQLLSRDGTQLNWYYNPSNIIQYQGAMPSLNQLGTATVHPAGTVDALNLFFEGVNSLYWEIPFEYLPRPGLHHIPLQATTNAVFPSGLNFMFLAQEGPNSPNSSYNQNIVSYPSTPGYYIVTPHVGETYGTAAGVVSIFGVKYTNTSLQSVSGGPFQGIQFPPFQAPARITGVYYRVANEVQPAISPFDNNRHFVGPAGADVNLLHDSFDGPTILLDVDVNGDLYFILNADALDMTKAQALHPGATFANSDFMVECVLFGYDRGFLQTNGRICLCRTAGVAPNNAGYPGGKDQFTTSADGFVGIITPSPMTQGASNNQVTLYYSRQPYQGDPFGTQNAYSDDLYRLGPLTVGQATSIYNSPLGPIPTLTLPNETGFEVLASTSFAMSLGTGRLSGSQPLPLLDTTEAPNNPPDFAGTLVDLARKFSANRVGYENWFGQLFPVTAASVTTRPPTVIDALDEVYDNYEPPEFAGATTQLPLGIYFRDKDFIGKTLYQQINSSGIGANSFGNFTFIEYESSLAPSAPGTSTWEGTEFVCGSTSGTAGVGSESVIRVDGTNTNPSSVTVFKTTRGGAAWSATAPWTGGVISSRFPKLRPNIDAGSVLVGSAFLVRSQPESSGMTELHMGNELQMFIVTQAVPSYFRETNVSHSAAGTNEGFTAVDRYRLLGKPLEKRRGEVDMTVLPVPPPLFVTNIYDNPLFYGSSDVSLNAQEQVTIPVTVNGETVLTLPKRPLDPTAVQMFLNGVKLQYGVNYTVGGTTNQTVTYVVSLSNPPLLTTDTVEFYYLTF
jgi:hypothetical protein